MSSPSPYASHNDGVISQFRDNAGRVQGFGDRLILVHHLGAKSGTERIAPVMGIPDGADAWLIAASKAGAPDHPAWYHNLLAHPDVTIETPQGEVPVRVEELHGAERDAGWAQFTSASPGFADYEKRTSRTIPVLRLTRRAS